AAPREGGLGPQDGLEAVRVTGAAMTVTRRRMLQLGVAAAAAPAARLGAAQPAVASASPRIQLAVSTYSYWHFKTEKYPIEKVFEHAAALGFDGVEILHRQMKDETPAYVSGPKHPPLPHRLPS